MYAPSTTLQARYAPDISIVMQALLTEATHGNHHTNELVNLHLSFLSPREYAKFWLTHGAYTILEGTNKGHTVIGT